MNYKKMVVLLASMIMLTGCMSSEAKNAQKKIGLLPDSYSEEIEDALSEAKRLYDALEDKENVDRKRIDDLENSKIVFLVQSAVDLLPEEYSIEAESICKDAIKQLADIDSSLAGLVKTERLNSFNAQRTEKINNLISSMDTKASESPEEESESVNRNYEIFKECYEIIMAMPDEYLSEFDFETLSAKLSSLVNVIDGIYTKIENTPSGDRLTDFTNETLSITSKYSILEASDQTFIDLAVIKIYEDVMDYIEGYKYAPQGKEKVEMVLNNLLHAYENKDLVSYSMAPAYLNDAFIELVKENLDSMKCYEGIDSKSTALIDMTADIYERTENK